MAIIFKIWKKRKSLLIDGKTVSDSNKDGYNFGYEMLIA